MPPTDQVPSTDTLLLVIRTLTIQLEDQQRAMQEQQRATEEANRQVVRLMAMVEGLTKQLDELLRDRDEELRAELAKVQAEAQAAAEAAAAALASVTDAPTADTTPPAEPPPKRKNRHEHGKTPIPSSLPRDVRESRPDRCSACGSTEVHDRVGPDPIEEYDYVRAHLRVRRTHRYGCACDDCGALTPPPPPPPMPFDRASCTFALMAWLCFAKCSLFLPLDRQCRDFEAQGFRIPSATMTRWWSRGADLLMPVAASVRASLLCDTHLRMDGTGMRVVYPRVKGEPVKGPARPGETDAEGYLLAQLPVNGQIMVYGNDDHVVFAYTPTREGDHILDFLTVGEDAYGQPIRWKGTVTADALSAYDCLFDEDVGCTESGCNSHGFRKFRDEADKAPLLASIALGFIDRFFQAEREAQKLGLRGAALLAHRQADAGPAVREFRAWLDRHIGDLLESNPIRKAMQYYINHWTALTRFLVDADVPLDNNWSERALRKIALLRNNSLYAGGEAGVARLCTLFTLIATCRQIGVDAYRYLEWALTRVVPHPDNRGLVPDDLTPAAYKASLAA